MDREKLPQILTPSPGRIERRKESVGQSFETPNTSKTKPRLISTYYLGLAGSYATNMPMFETYCHWKRDAKQWRNDSRLRLSQQITSMIILYLANSPQKATLEKLSVIYKNEAVYSKLVFTEPVKLSKTVMSDRNQWFMIDMPVSRTKNKLISHVKLQFANPTAIEEVIILRCEAKLLEIVGAATNYLPAKSPAKTPSKSPAKSPRRLSLYSQHQTPRTPNTSHPDSNKENTPKLSGTPVTKQLPLPTNSSPSAQKFVLEPHHMQRLIQKLQSKQSPQK